MSPSHLVRCFQWLFLLHHCYRWFLRWFSCTEMLHRTHLEVIMILTNIMLVLPTWTLKFNNQVHRLEQSHGHSG